MIRFIIGIILGIAVIIFFVQNPEAVQITFLAWTITMSKAIFTIGIFIAGSVIGWILTGLGRLRRRR
jgi:uncharacterized integral membrane protein